jgi:hypothetical protein
VGANDRRLSGIPRRSRTRGQKALFPGVFVPSASWDAGCIPHPEPLRNRIAAHSATAAGTPGPPLGWNTNGTLDEGSTVGRLLQTLIGYDGDPSLLELGVWLAFLLATLTLFLRPLLRRSRPAIGTT